MQQLPQPKSNKRIWIACGVIVAVVICLSLVAVTGGAIFAGILGSRVGTPTVAAPNEEPSATPKVLVTREVKPTQQSAQAAPTTPPATLAAGDVNGVPYKAVVQIIAFVKLDGKVDAGWSGSGSIITPEGLILTNAHVVLSDRYYQVDHLVVAITTAPDAQPTPSYIAKVMQVDQALDIAVIRVETDMDGNPVDRGALNLPTVPMGDSDTLTLGDRVTIIGYPSIGGSTITLTRGDVSGFTAEGDYGSHAFIKTSATIAGGNSGGLAANNQGQLIGIPTQLGYGGGDQYVDCRVLVDTNRDGVVDDKDSCVPTGGFINALRPLHLAQPLIEAAERGEVNIKEGVQGEQGQAPPESTNAVLYQDDFSDPTSGWDDQSWENGAVGYVKGTYQMTVNKDNWLVWSFPGGSVADTIISVDTGVVNPTTGGDYGIMCRYQDDSNFYGMEVSEDGYFAIWKMENGETVNIYDWTYSESIPVGKVFNISAACSGNHLLLAVDKTLLADVTDDSFADGKFGVIAGTLDEPGLTVAFDNFRVYKP